MPKPLPDRKETLGQRAYYELRRRIVSGELTPGERLPLRTVANSLGMRIAPVGEALRDLNHDGLIEMESGWGARVRKLDADDLRNLHILRTAVECESIRHTTERALDGQVDELAKETDACIDGHGAPGDVQELDSAFHLGVREALGSWRPGGDTGVESDRPVSWCAAAFSAKMGRCRRGSTPRSSRRFGRGRLTLPSAL